MTITDGAFASSQGKARLGARYVKNGYLTVEERLRPRQCLPAERCLRREKGIVRSVNKGRSSRTAKAGLFDHWFRLPLVAK